MVRRRSGSALNANECMWRWDRDNEDAAAYNTLVRPLVESSEGFARDEARHQVALLRYQVDDRVFQRRAQLVNEARKYRRLLAEVDLNDPRCSNLSNPYMTEMLDIEKEISEMESSETT